MDDPDTTLSNDDLDFWVSDGTTEGTHYTLTAAQLRASAWNTWYLHSQVITTDPNTWTYSEFENAGTYIHFDYKHAGGSDDAWRASTTGTCLLFRKPSTVWISWFFTATASLETQPPWQQFGRG